MELISNIYQITYFWNNETQILIYEILGRNFLSSYGFSHTLFNSINVPLNIRNNQTTIRFRIF